MKKMLISNFNAVGSNNTLTFDKKLSYIFKDFFSNLTKSLLIKFPNAPNNYFFLSKYTHSNENFTIARYPFKVSLREKRREKK